MHIHILPYARRGYVVSFIKTQLFLSKVNLMKQNNEEQLEPRTKSSFSNIFPAPSFDEHDSPEEQLKKLVQLGESVICSKISVTSLPGREFTRDHRQFVPADAGNGPVRSHRPQAEAKCPAKSEEDEDHPAAAAEEASDEAIRPAEDAEELFS